MRYLLLICTDEKETLGMSEAEGTAMLQGWGRYSAELRAAGKYVAGERLRPVSDATTVRAQNGRMLLSDGPFAETKEQLGGYFVIEAKDLDEAIEWAAKMPHLARGGSAEVRPIWEM